MIKKGLSFLLVLALFFSLLPAAAMGAEASEGTYYSYEDIVERTYDLSYLAKDPLPGEGGKQITSTDPASQYNEETGLYENWSANLDNSGYVRYEDGWRVIADLEGPGYMTRFWIPTLWHGTMQLFIDGELIYEGSTADFIWGSCFSEYSELSFQANYHDTEQFGPGYLGGIDLFVPITYNESLKLRLDVNEGNAMYYNLSYYELEDGASVESFTWPMSEETKAILKAANDILLNETAPVGDTTFAATVGAGETVTLFESATPGALTSMAMDIDIPTEEFDDRNSLVDWVISMYWDGAAEPAVCLPVADFFGIHYGKTAFDSAAYGLEEDGTAYCRWYMPFNSARITLTNQSDSARAVSCSLGSEALTTADDLNRFHANWQRSYARNDDRYPEAQLLSITGEGRYVGTSLHIYQIIDGIWWGEGDEKFYIDGEKYPTWFGTGSEDYFCYAWCGSMLFDYPYCGQPHNDGYPATGEKQVQGHGDKVNYRQHITDNIVFYESFEANIEKYFNETVDKYAATTYFYLTAATTGNHVAAAPAREDRLFNNDVLTAPTLFYPGAYISSRVIDSNTSVVPWLQPTDQFTATEGEWFGGLNYMWNISAKGKYINYLLDIPEGGSYDMNVSMTVAPDYGIFEFYLDDVLIGTVDTFHSSVDLKTVKLGTVELTPGAHELQIRCAGKSLSSAGYIMGLNYIELAEADGKPVETPAYEYFFGGYDDLYAALDSSDFNVVTQGIGDFTNYTWHGNAHILWAGAESGSTNFKINVPTADTYTMTLSRTLAADFGIFDIAIDGTVVAQDVDSYRPGGVFGEVSKYYSIDLTAGEHTLSFISKGKNAASAGYLIGIDYVQFNTQTDFGAFYGAYNQLLSLADENTTAALGTQDLGWVALNKWYHNTQLWWNDRGTASFTVTLPEDGYYDITTQYTMAGDYGKFDLLIDGEKIGQTVDAYGALDLGTNVNKNIYLTGGDHTLAIVSAGKNDASGGYIIGLSSIDFLGDTDVPEKENYSYFFGGYDDLFPLVDSANSDYAPVTQGLTSNYYTFHDNAHMLWTGGESGKVDFVVTIPTTDTYTMSLSRTLAVDFGIFDIAIDGTIVAQNVDSFQPGGVFGEVSKYYFIDLTEGAHTISFISKGKNTASAGYLIGIDYVQFDTQTNFGAFYGGFNDLLAAVDENNSAALSVQDLGWVAVNVWHHNNQLMWNDQNTASFTIELPADGYYDITTEYTMAGDYGMFELAIDGNKIGETVDAYGALGLGTVTTADVCLTKGPHTLTISCAGKNEASSGYIIGISSIDFLGDTEAPATEEPGESLSKIQRAAYEALRSYAENALAQADSLQKPHINRAMADGMIAIAAAADDEVAALLAEAKAAIDTVLAATYEEELEIDLLDDLFYEGAEMPTKVSSYTSNVEPHGQGMGAAWSGSGHMFWPANENGEMCVTIHVPYAATYTGSFAYTRAGDFGIYDVYLDDIKILEGIDSYAATISVKSVDFGEISLTEGDHVLKIVITGKNSASANYYMAIDHLILSGINEVIQYRASACKYLDGYKLEEDYSPEQWQVLQAVIAEQKTIINGCATVDDVIAAWKNAKAVINAIDTGLVDYENITFDAAKTPADFGWHSDDDNYTNWQTTADGRTFFISYPGSNSQRIWKELLTDPDNFTLTAEVKVGEKRAYMELFGVTIELNCENGNGNQIFDKENWAWFDAEDQICFVTISRVEGGNLNITLSGKGNATEVGYTKPVADDTNTNFFFGLWDAGASAYISDIAVTGVEAQSVDNFGWDTDEIDGSKDFSGWTSLDGTDITAVYADTTGNHRIWKGLVEDQNNFTVYADFTALTESSAYIKLLGQTLELDARNGNGAQLGVKLNGTFRDWIAAENLHAQVYLTRVDGGDIAVTIVTNGKTTKAEYTLS
ncbi:MAG: DUF2961 domain-containing protein, partial [Oscillospiraceae bacterium]|nr:DUF2961 domain-containing protein [Oscillospiraceae bacterium]